LEEEEKRAFPPGAKAICDLFAKPVLPELSGRMRKRRRNRKEYTR